MKILITCIHELFNKTPYVSFLRYSRLLNSWLVVRSSKRHKEGSVDGGGVMVPGFLFIYLFF